MELRSLLTDSFRETDEKLLSWLQSEPLKPLLVCKKALLLCHSILLLEYFIFFRCAVMVA